MHCYSELLPTVIVKRDVYVRLKVQIMREAWKGGKLSTCIRRTRCSPSTWSQISPVEKGYRAEEPAYIGCPEECRGSSQEGEQETSSDGKRCCSCLEIIGKRSKPSYR